MNKKNASDLKVVILGGGVIGLTTGLILRLHGYKVTVVSKHSFKNLHHANLAERPSELASIHAAASVIPHTVNHPSEKEILAVSQSFFHRLAFSAGFGVRVQRHYELHERELNPPEYARTVKDFTLLPDNGSGWVNDHNIPRRKGAKGVWGWYFNAFFAEVPTYMANLEKLYEEAGGRHVIKEIRSKEEIKKIDADIVVNCLGRWAMDFFPEDKKNTKVIRGHMVKVGIHEVPHDQSGQYFSYNYEPNLETYWREQVKGERTKADVYFYPRSDGWLLGGSRQEGYPKIGEDWGKDDEQISGEKVQLPNWDLPIPRPIWELNRELVYDITGIDIADPKYPSFSYVGYRFGRNIIRIEKEKNWFENDEKVLVHNYGHGGAGYSLSWGSAYEVLKIIENDLNVNVEIGIDHGMENGYQRSMRKILTDLVIDLYIERKRNEFTPYLKSEKDGK